MQDRKQEAPLDEERQVHRVRDGEEAPLGSENRCPCGFPRNVCWRCSSPDDWQRGEQ